MGRPGLRKKNRYSEDFKATAVKLSGLSEVRVQDVAEALDITHSCCHAGARKFVTE